MVQSGLAGIVRLGPLLGDQSIGRTGQHQCTGQVLILKDGASVAPLISLIVREGGEVQEVRSGQGSLEDVFLTLMEEEK